MKSKKRFLRSDWMRYSRIGKKRKKLQKWRRPRGMHSKIRKSRKGYPSLPTIGYKTGRKTAGRIKGLVPILVHNLNDLGKADKHSIVIIASRVGARKRIDIIKKAAEMKFKISNVRDTGDKK